MKKRLTKKILSMITAIMLVVSMLAVNVYADTEGIQAEPAAAVEAEAETPVDEAVPAAEEDAQAEAAEEDAAEPASDADVTETAQETENQPAADEPAAEETPAADDADAAQENAPADAEEPAVTETEAAPAAEEAPATEEAATEPAAEVPAAAEEAAPAAETADEAATAETAVKAAAEGNVSVAMADCIQIGEDEDMEAVIYYKNIGDAGTVVELTDFADSMSKGTVSGLAYSGYVGGTNIIDLTDGFGTTYDFLQEEYGESLDAAACEGLDFSNIYGLFVMNDDWDSFIFIIQGEHIEEVASSFTLDKGTVAAFEKDGYSYTYNDWYTGEPVTVTMDLYTVNVPIGTDAVTIGFEEELLAYAYAGGTDYIDSCGEYGDGTKGQTTAVAKAIDGYLPRYIYVQTPYDSTTWISESLYAIEFVQTYQFTASYNGKELTNIEYTPDNYSYYDYMTGETHKVGTYTITIPNEAESIDFVLSDNVLHYNYTKEGEFLGGWVVNFQEGDLEFSQMVDYEDTQVAADGIIDYIQIQTPYDAAWNSTLLYTITFQYVDPAADPGQKPEDIPSDIAQIYSNVSDAQNTFMADEKNQIYTAEWVAMELSRAGYEVPDGYYMNILDTVLEKDGKLDTTQYDYTNYARVILALTAGGKDPRDVSGYDLTAALADYDAILNQGINGAMYALIALDSGNYKIPDAAEGKTQATRENLINAILAAQHEDGGWAYGATEASDPDMIGIALQALAPYYWIYNDVQAAVDKALTLLSSMQTAEGTFNSDDAAGAPTCESTAQVVVALTALGINPAMDERFVKDGVSAIDGLCSFWTDGGFKHIASGAWNVIATTQGYYALVSYYRLLEGKTSLYNMTDAELEPLCRTYEGTHINFLKKDGSRFGMWEPNAGTTVKIDGDNVVIHYVPKNKTTYAGFAWGSITREAYADKDVQPEVAFATDENGLLDITVSKKYCGSMIPIAVVKKSYGKDTWTSADQYYLSIPSEEDLLATGGHTALPAVDEETEPTYENAGYIETVVYCELCGDEISRSEPKDSGKKALKDQAADAAAAAEKAAEDASKATGEEAVEKAEAAVKAAEEAKKAADTALAAAKEEGLDEATIAKAQEAADAADQAATDAKVVLAADQAADAFMKAYAEEDEKNQRADLKDDAVVILAQLDSLVDPALNTAKSYAVYEKSYKAFKELLANDAATAEQIRTARSRLLGDYQNLVKKAKQALKVTGKNASKGYADLAKAAGTFNLVTASGNKGKLTYSKASGTSYATVNAATGVITLKKGTPAGTYSIGVKAAAAATDDYLAASTTVTVKITVKKAAQSLTVKKATKSTKVAKTKKKKVTIKGAVTVKNAQGKVTYTKKGGSKYLTINKTTGKITVKKGTPKGTYKIKVKVRAAGDKNYKAAAKTVTVKIKVKK